MSDIPNHYEEYQCENCEWTTHSPPSAEDTDMGVYCHKCGETLAGGNDRGERVPTEDYDDIAEALAEHTGEPKEKFEPDYDEYPLPEPHELEESIDQALRGEIATAQEVSEAVTTSDEDPLLEGQVVTKGHRLGGRQLLRAIVLLALTILFVVGVLL